MAEFRIVEIIARRFKDGKEECQVQWAVTWETVDAAFAKGQLYKEFMEDLNGEKKALGNPKYVNLRSRRLTTWQKASLE